VGEIKFIFVGCLQNCPNYRSQWDNSCSRDRIKY